MEEGRKMNFAPYQPLPRINEGLKPKRFEIVPTWECSGSGGGWNPKAIPPEEKKLVELDISHLIVREKLEEKGMIHELDPLNPMLNEGTMLDKLRKALETEADEELTVFKERLREELLRAIERQKKKKEVQHMINLQNLMKLVENNTTVRIECKEEEMLLTPHRLAVYGEHMVEKLWVNCQGELTIVLTDDKPMHCR